MSWNRRSKLKYGNRSKVCSSNHKHDSIGEAMYCEQLKLLVKAGGIRGYEYEKRYILYVNEKRICTHKPDFTITNLDGTQEIHEFKGFQTQLWNIKRKIFEATIPEIPYKVKGEGDLIW